MRNLLKKRMKRVALFIGIVLACSHPAAANLCEFDGEKVVANQELDTMRGGFITTSGLEISISIIKAVVVDGALQTVSQLNMQLGSASKNSQPVITTYTPTANQTADESAAPTITVIPAAASGNSGSPTIVINSKQTELATFVQNFGGPIVVQNSKDGVTIQNNTAINATTNSVTLMRQMNLSSRINQQMINAAYH
jgi:hypothetical protein